MSDAVDTTTPADAAGAPIPFAPPRRRWRRRRAGADGRPPKPRIHKLRLALILLGLLVLALISTVFGMMMAVASDLPELENKSQYKSAENSILYDDHWRRIGIFAPPNNVVLVKQDQIAQSMKDAIVAIEDKRFYTNPGVDLRGIGRAFVSDVLGGRAVQGASTIAQQFVKNALQAQNNRTVFEKLREAALAYHLTRKWRKEKILTEYLNSIYFGNGAYGVESAARVYFGKQHGFPPTAQTDQSSSSSGSTDTSSSSGSTDTTGSSGTPTPQGGCGDAPAHAPCVSVLAPYESALLAGMVASPSAFDPLAHPVAAKTRRDLVLLNMLHQGYITRDQYAQGVAQPVPTKDQIQTPDEPTAAPYFTSWLRPQILAAVARGLPPAIRSYRAYFGGLQVKTTIDLDMQKAAQDAVDSTFSPGSGGPTASLVMIDNKTGEVRAMVGGDNYSKSPFNLATAGHRQPGSSFKPFTLVAALESGKYGPDSVVTSAPGDFIVPHSGHKEHFIVHNFADSYSGSISLAGATAVSDNSVFARVGIDVGTTKIARVAERMGIRSPISDNYAMILGGLKIGVTPLDMAHAYETLAEGGRKVINPALGAPNGGPIGIAEIHCPVCTHKVIKNEPTYERIMPARIAATVHSLLTGVVQGGTGTHAQIAGVDVAGKTGTTSNYGDAWFVGWTPEFTAAVWVGHPDKLVSMSTDYNGQPVEGGTFPAEIWHNFMVQALAILAQQKANAQAGRSQGTTTTDTTGSGGGSSGGGGQTSTATSTGGGGASGGGGSAGGGAGTGTGAAGAGAGASTNSGTGAGTGGGGSGAGSGGGGGSGGAGLSPGQ
jgi:penicillin-binding protein 1A